MKLINHAVCRVSWYNTCIMAIGWSTEVTQALIVIWREQNIQEQLDSVSGNETIHEKYQLP